MPIHGQKRLIALNLLKKNIFSGEFVLLALVLGGLVFSPACSFAAPPKDRGDEQLSITTRYNPAYEPQGFKLGGFTIFPAITNGVKYQDNVYATDLNKMHDLIYTTKPEVSVRSDFVRHALDFNAYFERGLYRDLSSENYSDYGGKVDARIDVSGQTNIPINFTYDRSHVRRGSPDERAALKPSFYQMVDTTIGLAHEGQMVAAKFIAGFKRFIYDNTIGLAGTQDNGDRDHNEYSLYASVGMNSDAFIAPYIYTDLTRIEYDRAFDNNGFNRDADQIEGGIGTIVNFSDVTSASVHLGRVHKSMDDSQLDNIDGWTYGINLKWEPSTLASFLLEGDRTIQETTSNGVSGNVQSSLRLTMNYELFPNVIVQPSAGLTENDYRGGSGGRTLTTQGSLQISYKMNQNFWLNTLYQYTNQDEKEPSPDLTSYEDNTYGVSLRLQF